MGRAVIVSGPSGTGKTPLLKAVNRFHPEIKLNKVVLYTSRPPRKGEIDGIDYHFGKSKTDIMDFPKEKYLVFPVHDDFQALDLVDLKTIVDKKDGIGYLEIFYEKSKEIAERLRSDNIDVNTVFISPLSKNEADEIIAKDGLSALREQLTEIMMKKIIQRTLNKNNTFFASDLPDTLKRAKNAFKEIQFAKTYDYVLPNHDGEDSQVWGQEKLSGDAARTLESFVALLRGQVPKFYEKWSPFTCYSSLSDQIYSGLIEELKGVETAFKNKLKEQLLMGLQVLDQKKFNATGIEVVVDDVDKHFGYSGYGDWLSLRFTKKPSISELALEVNYNYVFYDNNTGPNNPFEGSFILEL